MSATKKTSIFKIIIDGLKFGMLLQFAIGPITLLILQLAISGGFIQGFMGVLGAFIADALFVVLAILGVGALIKRYPKQFDAIKWSGAVVMVIFGLAMVLSVFGIHLLPQIKLVDAVNVQSALIKVFILTTANPMTILFWTGVFAAKVGDFSDSISAPWLYGGGAVAATLLFQTLVVAAGVMMNLFIEGRLLEILNGLVGVVIIVFGMKLIIEMIRSTGGGTNEVY